MGGRPLGRRGLLRRRPPDHLGLLVAGGRVRDAFFAYGRAPGRDVVTLEFEHHQYEVPVTRSESGASSKWRPTLATADSPSSFPDPPRRAVRPPRPWTS